MAQLQATNPLAFFQGLAQAAQQHPLLKQASTALNNFQSKQEDAKRHHNLPPRVVVMPRHAAVAAIIPGDSIAEQVLTSGLSNFLNLYNTALICRLVLTWFPNPPAFIVTPLSTVCDPYLNLFRGLLPPLGGTLDLSPILAFVVLNLFTNTSMALPAEIPAGQAAGAASVAGAMQPFSQVSKSEAAFQRRVAAQRAEQGGSA